MSLETLLSFGLPCLIAAVAYCWKTLMQRLNLIEQELRARMSEEEVRRLLSDKLEPVSSDLLDIKDSVNRLLDYILKLPKE